MCAFAVREAIEEEQRQWQEEQVALDKAAVEQKEQEDSEVTIDE